MKITSIWARQILDSRGNPTVEVEVIANGVMAAAAAPSGASTGIHEAVELRDGGRPFLGKGVLRAVSNVNEIIGPALVGMDATDPAKLDLKMRELDGTKDKSNLGANAMVATSMALYRVAGLLKNQVLYEYLGGSVLPRAMFNIINGGKHAGGKLAIQEFMVIPSGDTFAERLMLASEIYHILGKELGKKYGPSATNVGDEGGYAPQMENTEDALDAIVDAIDKAGYGDRCDIALDAAASSFYDNGKYKIDGKKLDVGELHELYVSLSKKYKIISIEDPFYEEDFVAFAELNKRLGPKVQVVGDDLLVTNISRIKQAIEHDSVSALLLKVNQIGTVSEALEAVDLCSKNNLNVVVSHRSGETEDSFIADLSVGINCGQIKSGAPARGERTAKYNQLLRIEERLMTQM